MPLARELAIARLTPAFLPEYAFGMPSAPEEAQGGREAGLAQTARKTGLGLTALVAFYLIVASSWQIMGAVLSPPVIPSELGCRAGIQRLLQGVQGARARAASKSEGEKAALTDFRKAIDPVWAAAPHVLRRCQETNDRAEIAAFRAVEALRYAEERAVRYEALDLSRIRRRAPELAGALPPP